MSRYVRGGGSGGGGGGGGEPKKTQQLGGRTFDVQFAGALSEETFRVTLTRGSNEVLQMLVEAKRSKQQWEKTITELPAGVPPQAVFEFLEKALVLRRPGAVEADEDDMSVPSVVTASLAADGITLTLTCNISEVWRPEYTFKCTNKEVSELEVVKSQLKDTQEEIRELRPVFLRLKQNNEAVGAKQPVAWDVANALTSTGGGFGFSADGTRIAVHVEGVYQINVQMVVNHSVIGFQNGVTLELRCNDVALVSSYDGCANNCFRTSNLSTISRLQAQDVLQLVYVGGNGQCPGGQQPSNNLTMVRLA